MKWDNCKTDEPDRTKKVKEKFIYFLFLLYTPGGQKVKKFCEKQIILVKSLFFAEFQCQEG